MPQRVIIIGSGPAGYTAALYLARSGLDPVLFSGPHEGGQLIQTHEIENFPGFPGSVSGYDLMDRMKTQARSFGTQIFQASIIEIQTETYPFQSLAENGTIYSAEAIILATGATAKWLGIPGEKEFKGYGVSGCATCDGFFYRGKTVVVVGGGNTAVSDALFLTRHADRVFLVHRRDFLRAEAILQKRLFENDKIQIIWNSDLVAIQGEETPKQVKSAPLQNTLPGEESPKQVKSAPLQNTLTGEEISKRVTSVILQNTLTGEKTPLKTDGVFIAIGHEPQTSLVKGKVELTPTGYVVTQPGSTQTSVRGIFAAGDVADEHYQQAVTAAGFGCMAALDVEKFFFGGQS